MINDQAEPGIRIIVKSLQTKPGWSDLEYGVSVYRACSEQDLFLGIVSEEAVKLVILIYAYFHDI